MSASNYGENLALAALWTASARYLQLHSGDPGEDGTTNVVSIGRQQVFMTAPASGTTSNSGPVEFSGMPAVSVVAWSAFDALGTGLPPVGGNCVWTGWFNPTSGTNHGTAQVDDEDLVNNDVESPTHGLATDNRVYFEALEAFAIPAGLVAGTLYLVLAAGLADDVFRVSTTSGGAAADITAEGQCVWRRVQVTTLTAGQLFRVATGDLDVFLD